VYCCGCSSSSIWWYPHFKSSLENTHAPVRFYIVGIGYLSRRTAMFTLHISTQIRISKIRLRVAPMVWVLWLVQCVSALCSSSTLVSTWRAWTMGWIVGSTFLLLVENPSICSHLERL
jgi:hypothetical protein